MTALVRPLHLLHLMLRHFGASAHAVGVSQTETPKDTRKPRGLSHDLSERPPGEEKPPDAELSQAGLTDIENTMMQLL
jgi:hypothetical protein